MGPVNQGPRHVALHGLASGPVPVPAEPPVLVHPGGLLELLATVRAIIIGEMLHQLSRPIPKLHHHPRLDQLLRQLVALTANPELHAALPFGVAFLRLRPEDWGRCCSLYHFPTSP